MGRPALLAGHITQILQTQHVLTAPAILMALEADGVSVNKTSVYRALEKLESDGAVCKQTLTGEDIVYELRAEHHDHLVCEVCGSVEKIECLTTTPAVVNGFTIHHHHTTLFGKCKKCSEKSRL